MKQKSITRQIDKWEETGTYVWECTGGWLLVYMKVLKLSSELPTKSNLFKIKIIFQSHLSILLNKKKISFIFFLSDWLCDKMFRSFWCENVPIKLLQLLPTRGSLLQVHPIAEQRKFTISLAPTNLAFSQWHHTTTNKNKWKKKIIDIELFRIIKTKFISSEFRWLNKKNRRRRERGPSTVQPVRLQNAKGGCPILRLQTTRKSDL